MFCLAPPLASWRCTPALYWNTTPVIRRLWLAFRLLVPTPEQQRGTSDTTAHGISQHDSCRYEHPPVSMNLHHVTRNGTREEYLVKIVAMTIVEDWTVDSEPAPSPDIMHTSSSDGHDSMEAWSQACRRNYQLVHGHQRPRSFNRTEPRMPPLTLKARPEPTFTVDAHGGVWYQTPSDLTSEDEDDGTIQWVQHCPTAGQRLVVNTWTLDSFVATHFMSNGVPVTYNLRISSAYIPMRHRVEYETEMRKLLRHWYRSTPALYNRGAGSVPLTPALGDNHGAGCFPRTPA